MNDVKEYLVRPLKNEERISVSVPGSKSVTNRALLLAAMRRGDTKIEGILLSDDSRALIDCLLKLGYPLKLDEKEKTVIISGNGPEVPNRKASVNVRSAGTAARFLTVFLAFAGGDYELNASDQMCRRPMEPLINALRSAGVTITCHKEEGHFPFSLSSKGIEAGELSVDTDVSSQFASAMLMAAPILENGLNIHLEGSRTRGSYIGITLNMMKSFGLEYTRTGDSIYVNHSAIPGDFDYRVEPDVSAACYFYAMAPICNKTVQVKNVHLNSMQGDIRFIDVLKKLGCSVSDDPEGLTVYPPKESRYPGIDVDMKDFSDQTMTMAVVAAFADSATKIRNVGHIRFQESDRLNAIITELNRLGCSCRATDEGTGILIEPSPMNGASIETYEDHRIAMAFSLIGLRVPDVIILDPMCCRKTFEDYFKVLDHLCL